MAASILDRYGIKEVCDFTFYKLEKDGTRGAPALYLDTLKVSTTEQTAENTSARGGKGNPELITWDYGKEINVTLEDALFSAKSMAIMFGSVDTNGEAVINTTSEIVKTVPKAQVKKLTYGAAGSTAEIEIRGTKVPISGVKLYDEKGALVEVSQEEGAQAAYAYLTGTIEGKNISEIVISAETFPGNYYCTGDTYARSEASGEDEFFQLVIPKAKVTSENTLTMEAEGDPSTFSMNLKVLRPADGKMMKLIKYSLTE
nr:MAG TPA: structural protein [Caudoviricetes sp.]